MMVVRDSGKNGPRLPAAIQTPRAVRWLQELEQANAQRGKAHLWREIRQRVRQRDAKGPGGLDWPGHVYLPSPMVETMLKRQLLDIPQPWQSMGQAKLLRLIALLAAWEHERGIYGFTPTSAQLVLNCSANVSLVPQLFRAIPSHAVYIDFDTLKIQDTGLPHGFFACMNQNESGNSELILVVDESKSLDVLTLPLDGRMADDLIAQNVSLLRKRGGRKTPIDAQTRDFEQLLHLMLSALLMTRINQHRMKPVSEGEFDPAFCPRDPWTQWEVGYGVDEQVLKEVGRQVAQGYEPVVIANWTSTERADTVRLLFSVGHGYDFSVSGHASPRG